MAGWQHHQAPLETSPDHGDDSTGELLRRTRRQAAELAQLIDQLERLQAQITHHRVATHAVGEGVSPHRD